MKKKVLCLLLSVLLCLSLLPVSVSAADYIPITQVAATVTEPVAGEHPDYAPTVATVPADALDTTQTEVNWFAISAGSFTGTSSDSWDKLSSEDVFEVGFVYAIEMYVHPTDAYEFPTDVIVTVNGKPHDNTYGEPYSGSTEVYVSAVFTDLSAPPQDALQVAVDEPLLGNYPDITPTFNPDSVTVKYFQWYKIPASVYNPSGANEWTEMDSDEWFEAEYFYGFEIDGEFTGGYHPGSNIILLNGHYPTDGYCGETGFSLIQVYEPLASLVTEINVDITAPALGALPDLNPVITSTPKDKALLAYYYPYEEGDSNMAWAKCPVDQYTGQPSDSWEPLGTGETFEEGYYYMFVIMVQPYIGPDGVGSFKLARNVKLTVNGQPNWEFGLVNSDNVTFLAHIFEPLKAVNPPTADNNSILLWGGIASAALLAMAAVVAVEKKKKMA